MTQKELEAYIFKTITTGWCGARMLFPYINKEGKYKTIKIDGKDLMRLIKTAMRKVR